MRSYRLFSFWLSLGSIVLASLSPASCAEPVTLSGDGSQPEGGPGGGGSGETAGSAGSQAGASGGSSGQGGSSAGGSGASGQATGGASGSGGSAGSSAGGSGGVPGGSSGSSGASSGQGGASGEGGSGGSSGSTGGSAGSPFGGSGGGEGGSGGAAGSGGSGGAAAGGEAGAGGAAGAAGAGGTAGAGGGGPVGDGMLINEVFVDRTLAGDATEWIELLGSPSQPLDGVSVRHYELEADGTWTLRFDLPVGSAGDVTKANGTWSIGGSKSLAEHWVSISKPENWGMAERGTLQLYVAATGELLDVVAWGDMAGPDAPTPPLKTVQGAPVPFGPYVDNVSLGRKPGANSGDNAADFCVQTATINQPNAADCQPN